MIGELQADRAAYASGFSVGKDIGQSERDVLRRIIASQNEKLDSMQGLVDVFEAMIEAVRPDSPAMQTIKEFCKKGDVVDHDALNHDQDADALYALGIEALSAAVMKGLRAPFDAKVADFLVEMENQS